MGRLIRMRPRRSSFYALEETIASLHEELEFTLNYAQAMVRDRNYRAAAEVIDEQRRSLAAATKRMERAFAPEAPVRRQARVRAALVGVAATLALASGAFAAFGPMSREPAKSTKIQAVKDASEALIANKNSTNSQQLQQIVGDAQQQISLAAAELDTADPAVRATLLESVENLRSVLANPNVPASVREQARKVAQSVEKIVVDVEETKPDTETDTDAGAKTSAPTSPDTETAEAETTAPDAESVGN